MSVLVPLLVALPLLGAALALIVGRNARAQAIVTVVTLVAVSVWLARAENVRVSYESQHRPRVVVSSSPVEEHDVHHETRSPVPEPAR